MVVKAKGAKQGVKTEFIDFNEITDTIATNVDALKSLIAKYKNSLIKPGQKSSPNNFQSNLNRNGSVNCQGL